jgi:O-methyltransferase
MTIVQWLHHHLPGYQIRQRIRRRACILPGVSQHVLVTGHTWLPPARLKMLERHVRDIERRHVPGDVLECGVAAGGSAALLGKSLERLKSERTLYLFDTFEGLPPPTRDDPDYDDAVAWTGQCRGTVEEVKALFNSLSIPESRVRYMQGLFQDTLPDAPMRSVALAHLDGDWYESTRTCLTSVWPRLSVGGIIQLDDYGRWKGCRRAVDEFFAGRGNDIALRPIDEAAVFLQRLR